MNSGKAIPWSGESGWLEMQRSLQAAISNVDSRDSAIRGLAREIAEGFRVLDPVLDSLCVCCASCRDVCCMRATIWYDFEDILFWHYHFGEFPPGQVSRQPDGRCLHLDSDGCRLDRARRPFICSWYICPDQKSVMTGSQEGLEQLLLPEIERMKGLRKGLERKFVEQLCRSFGW